MVKQSAKRQGIFVSALIKEMELAAGERASFDTLYFGGGTPSLLAGLELARLLDAASSILGASRAAAIFLEANPEDVNAETLAAWRGLGVSTLSLGIQSFDAAELAFLGRRHGPEEAIRATELALGAGFATVSIDLIFGLPQQDLGSWRRSLALAVALAPQHISCYQLTVKEGTPFGVRRAKGELAEMNEEGQAEIFAFTHAFLADAGFTAYEVSNFAAGNEHRSRHNQKYWRHVPYLGLGPSAHSFDGERRAWNERNLSRYLGRLAAGERPIAGEEVLSRRELALEMLMLGLRTAAGIDLEAFRDRFGVDLVAANAGRIEHLIAEGLLARSAVHLAPTVAGLAVADGLAAALELPGVE